MAQWLITLVDCLAEQGNHVKLMHEPCGPEVTLCAYLYQESLTMHIRNLRRFAAMLSVAISLSARSFKVECYQATKNEWV